MPHFASHSYRLGACVHLGDEEPDQHKMGKKKTESNSNHGELEGV